MACTAWWISLLLAAFGRDSDQGCLGDRVFAPLSVSGIGRIARG
ncbi:hypothetical protein [Almyronema epifaneia]